MAQEKNFENRIKKWLDHEKIWYVKYFANGYTKKGIPDILACVNGRFVGIEVKAENGIVAPLQTYQKTQIIRSGGVSIIVRPSQFEDFKTLILSIKNDPMIRRIRWQEK